MLQFLLQGITWQSLWVFFVSYIIVNFLILVAVGIIITAVFLFTLLFDIIFGRGV